MDNTHHESVDELVYGIDKPRLIQAPNGPLAYWCNVGLRQPPNEDAQFIDTIHNTYASIDGMGGHSHGELAARYLAEACQAVVRDGGCVRRQVIEEIQESAAEKMQKEELGNGGACYVLFNITDGELRFAYAGDSRLVVVTGNETVFSTNDHELRGYVTNAVLTGKPGDVCYSVSPITVGQRIIAGSDGLWKSYGTIEGFREEMQKMQQAEDPLRALEMFRLHALNKMQQGITNPDNINIIVYDIERV